MQTLIIGASPKPHRFAYKALQSLQQHQHACLLFSPKGGIINNMQVCTSLQDKALLNNTIKTVTLYVNSQRLEPLINDIIALKPQRIIFNPGTESNSAQAAFTKAGITCIEDCTLIMLREHYY